MADAINIERKIDTINSMWMPDKSGLFQRAIVAARANVIGMRIVAKEVLKERKAQTTADLNHMTACLKAEAKAACDARNAVAHRQFALDTEAADERLQASLARSAAEFASDAARIKHTMARQKVWTKHRPAAAEPASDDNALPRAPPKQRRGAAAAAAAAYEDDAEPVDVADDGVVGAAHAIAAAASAASSSRPRQKRRIADDDEDDRVDKSARTNNESPSGVSDDMRTLAAVTEPALVMAPRVA